MPYRHQQFVNREIYHIIIRGIDDNLIFRNADDYYRAIFSIYEFNNANAVEIYKRRREIQTIKKHLKNKPGEAGPPPSFSLGFWTRIRRRFDKFGIDAIIMAALYNRIYDKGYAMKVLIESKKNRR